MSHSQMPYEWKDTVQFADPEIWIRSWPSQNNLRLKNWQRQKTAAFPANFCQIVQPTLTEGRKLFLLIAAKRPHGRFINSPNLGILPSHMAHSLEMSSQVDCSLYFKLN